MTSRFTIITTPLAGVLLIDRTPLEDERGFLERLFCVSELAESGVIFQVRQINRTLTRQPGTVRGMHFQRPPMAEKKLISCLAGRVYDVAVDLREGSSTFGKCLGVELAGDGHRSLIIPEGCAHGFQTMTANCEMLYLHSNDYSPQNEGGVNPIDPMLAISWPLPVAAMSPRDAALPWTGHPFRGI